MELGVGGCCQSWSSEVGSRIDRRRWSPKLSNKTFILLIRVECIVDDEHDIKCQ